MTIVSALWLLFVGAALYKLSRAFGDYRRRQTIFSIRVEGGHVQVDGRVPSKLTPQVEDFVANLSLPDGARVRALRRSRGFKLRYSRTIPAASRMKMNRYFHVD